jgi:4'-phosphopantetheinyl transferase
MMAGAARPQLLAGNEIEECLRLRRFPAGALRTQRATSGLAFLYYLPLCEPAATRLLKEHRWLLSAEEQRRLAGFAFSQHRNEKGMARALLRKALFQLTGSHPARWQFRQNSYGRPEIELPRAYRRFKFNVSHAEGLVTCLLAWDREVGVDVEPIRQIASPLNLARAQFAACETDAIGNLPAAEQNRAFLELWTLKEAYLKARGVGLSGKLSQIVFTVKRDAGYQITAMVPRLPGEAERWQFALRCLADHLVATAIERCNQGPVEMVLCDASKLMSVPGV